MIRSVEKKERAAVRSVPGRASEHTRSSFMEIERKFLVKRLPERLETYPSRNLEQAYLCTEPVVRVRRSDDTFILTYKGKGFLSREEYNLPLTKEGYEHLKQKADGNIIQKRRYLIPCQDGLTIELDLFGPPFADLILAEVEFASEEQAQAFTPPDWFAEEVTWSSEYHNSTLSQKKL